MTSDHFFTAHDVLKKVVRTIKTPNQDNYYFYADLLNKCLPEKWQNRVVLGTVEFGKWEVWVSSATEAQQLRFLGVEIEALLAKKLPFPPKLHFKPRPDVWRGKRHYYPMGRIYPRRQLSEQEADEILNAFLREEL